MLTPHKLMLVQHAASYLTVAVASKSVTGAKQEGISLVARHSNPKDKKSDWSTVRSLYATYSEDCQEHNKATIAVEQGS